ncbi:MAG: hypothetical protein WC971_08625 [Coriobacteriia bacterium]
MEDSVSRGSREASVALPPHTIKTGGRIVKGSSPVLSIRLDRATASVSETITANVKYSNVTTTTAVILYGGVHYFYVRATSSTGGVVFDSWPYPPGASLVANSRRLAPGETISGSIGFRVDEPGTYAVVAYLGDRETPSVNLVVTR